MQSFRFAIAPFPALVLALACSALTTTAAASASASSPAASSASSSAHGTPPPAPPAEPPPLGKGTVVVCVGCDQPFDAATHQELVKDLAKNPYVLEMRRAQYFQDTVHQFESKVHFDNCDFDDAEAYLTELFGDVRRHADEAQALKAKGDKPGVEAAVKAAFFSLGQALHGTQDFYAHTNYVELTAPKAARIDAIELIRPWTQSGRDRIAALRTQGLVSGFVWWGFPQKCPTGSPSHANLAKDSVDMKSGKVAVPNLQNLSQYKVAVFLARETSLKLLGDAFKTWPILKEVNGENVLFDVLVDRRAADTPAGT